MFPIPFLFFQSLCLFRLAGELEAKAASLHAEALQHMTIALAGVNCRELFTLLVTFFGKDTGIDPFSFLDAAPKIPVPLDLTDTESEEEVGGDGSSTAEGSEVVSASTSTAATPAPLQEVFSSSSTHPGASPSSAATSLQLQAQPSSSTSIPPSVPIGISTISSDPQPSSSGVLGEPPAKKIHVCPRQAYQDKVADIRSATRCYPSDADSLHNTGIPPQYAVRRAGASGCGTSLYDCPYSDLCSTPPYVGDFPSCGSHVRKVHLRVCLACPYCPEQLYYNGSGWRKHMRAEHPSVPWYTAQLQTPPVAPPDVVKQEVMAVPVALVTEAPLSAPAVPEIPTSASSLTLADIMEGPIPAGPLPLPAPVATEPPPPGESLPYVEEETEELTPEQEDVLLQAGDAPADDPSDDTETEEDKAINAAWEEMRAAHPEMSYEEMKEYLKHTFAPSDLRQFDFAVNRDGMIMSRYRKDGFASEKAAFALVQAGILPEDPPPPLETGEEPVLKRTAPQRVKVWPKPPTGLTWRANKREDFEDPAM